MAIDPKALDELERLEREATSEEKYGDGSDTGYMLALRISAPDLIASARREAELQAQVDTLEAIVFADKPLAAALERERKFLAVAEEIRGDLTAIGISCVPMNVSMFHKLDPVVRKLEALAALDAQGGGG